MIGRQTTVRGPGGIEVPPGPLVVSGRCWVWAPRRGGLFVERGGAGLERFQSSPRDSIRIGRPAVRRESQIPGGFFACFLARPRKQVPRRHETSGKPGPRHKRVKKEQTSVADRRVINPTVSNIWFRASGRAAASRSGARCRSALEPGCKYLFPADCGFS